MSSFLCILAMTFVMVPTDPPSEATHYYNNGVMADGDGFTTKILAFNPGNTPVSATVSAFDTVSRLFQPPGTGWRPQLYSSSIQ